MRRDAEGSTGPIWASDHDDRCTPFGAWLRHTNIDELPQLWNVLKGEMSVVGPRPERPIFVDRFRAEVPDYDLRHAVPAGHDRLGAGAWMAGADLGLRKRVQYDLDYIRRWSFTLDFRVMFMTVQHIAFRKTTWGESAGRRRALALTCLAARCSVIIPSYNGRRLLETCLASVVRHRPDGVEVIVADDASTDDTTSWLAANLSRS